ncbi:Terpene cyclase [Mycena indigotica]|uniref:Terpene synthase n=1 Tax=Mycena indigotica TaxID=2126181 RepID=A0A8H6SCJ9_9AGAR|nr:Terpene cyclase [Mycena indigotica]KAF7296929.1 Terpene cyclase [Mycena indigotica]
MSAGDIIVIPDTLRSWPWPRDINPSYDVCKKESAAWCEAFKAFGPKAQDSFNRCDFTSLAFPLLNREGCRIGCDLMNLFFVIDEHTDVAATAVVRQQADMIMDAIRHPNRPRPVGEWIGGEIARCFWSNATRTATPTAQRRFVEAFQQYMDGVVQQADDRNSSRIRDVDSYFKVRRETIGAKPSFAVNEIHLNIPDEVMADPIVVKLTDLSIDALIIGNDLCSYNVEQARGDDGHNLVTIVMHQYGLDVQQAMSWIGDLHDQIVDEFLHTWHDLPRFDTSPDLEHDFRLYVDGLGNWVRANDSWSFESERYFGKKGREVQDTRKTVLLPRKRDLEPLGV